MLNKPVEVECTLLVPRQNAVVAADDGYLKERIYITISQTDRECRQFEFDGKLYKCQKEREKLVVNKNYDNLKSKLRASDIQSFKCNGNGNGNGKTTVACTGCYYAFVNSYKTILAILRVNGEHACDRTRLKEEVEVGSIDIQIPLMSSSSSSSNSVNVLNIQLSNDDDRRYLETLLATYKSRNKENTIENDRKRANPNDNEMTEVNKKKIKHEPEEVSTTSESTSRHAKNKRRKYETDEEAEAFETAKRLISQLHDQLQKLTISNKNRATSHDG